MLILTRKPGEALWIGDGIKVIIIEIKGNQIRVGIEAPSEVRIYREEIWLQIKEENRRAAEAAQGQGAGDLQGLSEAWGNKKLLGAGAGFALRTSPTKGQPEILKKKGRKQGDE